MKTKPPRAWHKKYRKMYWVSSIEYYLQEISQVSLEEAGGEIVDGIVDGSDKQLTLLWPTGLQDKNGTEIYEGDIVKMNPVDDEWYDVVIFKKGHFELRSYKSPVTDCSLQDWCYGSSNPCIVIGNIHQNKDLLKKESP